MAIHYLGLTGEVGVTNLWEGKSLDLAEGRIVRTLPPHRAELYRLRK